ncbi:MAG: TonB-dependent receptor [Chitinophagaceae bacterium]
MINKIRCCLTFALPTEIYMRNFKFIPALLFIFLLLSFQQVNGQMMSSDSLDISLDEVVITATRTEQKLGNVTVPVNIISKKTIEQNGALRLKDILSEQPGINITSGFGAGIQMQGLNPDYTLILIDGEPLVGRTAGILDISRITVGNIRKIEIVKGPSSSLYGSEAMAGVINVITDKSFDNKLTAGLRYGTYNTWDANINGSTRVGKLGLSGFINSYNTNGYSLRPNSTNRAVSPIWRLTNQVQLQYPITAKTKLALSVRYNYEHIKNTLSVSNQGQTTVSNGLETTKDWNIHPVITHRFNDKLSSSLRLYATIFEGTQKLTTSGSLAYNDIQHHELIRVEDQTDYNFNKKLSGTFGGGLIRENVRSSRYDDQKNTKQNDISYIFGQAEFKPVEKLILIAGARFDKNALYASAFSPKLSGQYKFSEKLSMNASFGRGFKAPDFRQLYLNFTNAAAGSYSVYGSIDAVRIINELNIKGEIESLEQDFYKLAVLKPEFSSGINVAVNYQPVSFAKISVNLFRNDIQNLIDSRLVAYRRGGLQIYSYVNVDNAYTQGAEVNTTINITRNFTANAGYQFLATADKAELKEIRDNKVYTRDENNFSRLLTRTEYFGLPNRAKHMANLRFSYEKNSWFANTRFNYVSSRAVNDKDGNGLMNNGDEFAKAYALVNASSGYECKNGFRVQVGVDNIFDYADANYLPNMPGRMLYAQINYTIKQYSKKLVNNK